MTKVHVIDTPTDKILSKSKPDIVVQDSLGRAIKLKIPDALDEYDLHHALGNDSQNIGCLSMAAALTYVAEIDGVPFTTPHTSAEIRAGIKRLGKEGILAVYEAAKKHNIINENANQVEEIKKL